jgi:hypothetical protein
VAVGWWSVRTHGFCNTVSRGSGCAGMRTVSIISCPADSPESTDTVMPCAAWPRPRIRKDAPCHIRIGLYGH